MTTQFNVWVKGDSLEAVTLYVSNIEQIIRNSQITGRVRFDKAQHAKGDQYAFRFSVEYADKAILALDTEIMNPSFAKLEPEAWEHIDPFSVRYRIMPLGIAESAVTSAELISYLTEKNAMLTGELMAMQQRCAFQEQSMNELNYYCSNIGLTQLPDIVEHVNKELASIGCKPYIITTPNKH